MQDFEYSLARIGDIETISGENARNGTFCAPLDSLEVEPLLMVDGRAKEFLNRSLVLYRRPLSCPRMFVGCPVCAIRPSLFAIVEDWPAIVSQEDP